MKTMTLKGNKAKPLAAALCFMALLTACGGKSSNGGGAADGGDTVRYECAQLLHTVRHERFTEVSVSNPWKEGAVLQRYYLVPRADSAAVAATLPADGSMVVVPVQRALVATSPLCQLMLWLGAGDRVKAVLDAQYINQPLMAQRIAGGSVADCGNSASPDIERIVQVAPQAAFLSVYEGSDERRLAKTGCAVIDCVEYMEPTALGRAEWMKFYGLLLGREKQADSLFVSVKRNYQHIKAEAGRANTCPVVLTERVTGGTWFCPGGRSSMASLVADAHGRYAFASDAHSGSQPLAPEAVVAAASKAGIWLFVYSGKRPLTRDELLAEYHGYSQIKAFMRGDIFQCNNMNSLYFNEISFRPDFLLRDLAVMFHPEMHRGESLRYYEK